jgi:hypothetical protein
MKLGELKVKIRGTKGNIALPFQINGQTVPIFVQKSSLLEAMDIVFEKARNAETGYLFTDDGRLMEEGASTSVFVETDLDELDDLDAKVIDEIDDL